MLLLRYLKGTPEKRIWMRKNDTNDICGYSDAAWAESFDSKSTIGFYIFVDENLITWKSKKQKGYGEIKRRSGVSSHDLHRK
jgi:hypothetical protein